MCRYFKSELCGKKAIAKEDFLSFLTTWLDRSLPDCMFSPGQLKSWTSSHLMACPWYLECNFGVTPPEEEALFQALKDSVMVDPEVPEFSGLDNVAKTKAVKRRELSDRKKLDEAKRRTKEHEQKKLQARLEKEKEKESKKGTKRKASTACDEPASSGVHTSSRFRLMQERLVHGRTPTKKTLSPIADIDKCIMNTSLADLSPDSKTYSDVLSFLDVVSS